MSDRLLKESDVLKIAFQLPLVVNSAFADAVKALPSADRPQSVCEYGEYCMCATCQHQGDCSYCTDCTAAQKQIHDVWTCTKYMRKENLRKGADDE